MMATGIARPLARSLKGRFYGTAAAAKPKNVDDREPLGYIKKLANGLAVGSIESKSPVARIAVVANAGSRFESGQNLGVTHVLRHLPKLRTQNLSSLGITRKTLQLGSDIVSQSNREYVYYKSAVTRNSVGSVVEILQELTTKAKIVDWEFDDLVNDPNNLKLDLALLKTQPQIRAIEALHAAAFRNTLGQSLYAPEFQLGKYTPEQVLQYIKTYFSAGRLALIGVGVDQKTLEDLGRTFEPYKAAGIPSQPAVYYGGEIRENSGGDLSYVAVACGGPSQASGDLLPAEVLKHILGVGPHIKYSLGTASSVLEMESCVQQLIVPLQYLVSLPIDLMLASLSLLLSLLRRVLIRFYELHLRESTRNILSWLGEQTFYSDSIVTPHEVYKLVDNITTADVNKVAKALSVSRPPWVWQCTHQMYLILINSL
ncbi:Cytochrome b-c1 complex subunit 2, mitochondrial [Bulinus truncatus]|nr:Cytochrome b-c1 complex subunit 2, mitochondrial [Bulinus truncatus]